MRVPVGGLEEDCKERGAAENRMEGETFQKAVEGMGAAGGKVGAKAVAADVFEFVFVG